MSRFIKFAAAVSAIALTATTIAIVAGDGDRAARQERLVRYEVALDSRAPVAIGPARDATVRAWPSCHALGWRVTTVGRDAR